MAKLRTACDIMFGMLLNRRKSVLNVVALNSVKPESSASAGLDFFFHEFNTVNVHMNKLYKYANIFNFE